MRSTKKASGNDFGWDTDGFEGGHTSRVQGLALCFLLVYVIRVCGRLRFFEKGKSGILVGVFFLLLSGATPWSLYGQSPKMDLGYLYNEDGVSFKLELVVPRTRCGESAKPWLVRIIGNNVGKLRPDQRYLSWKIPTINCAGYRINRAFSVNIKEFPFADGVPMMASDWNFVAASVDSMLMEVRLGPTERVEKDENLGLKDPLVFKGSIERDSEITEGESVALQVVSSVRLREGAVLVWYEGSCGGKELQRGEVLRVSPAKTTTYYVRAELDREVSECLSMKVVVHKKVAAPEPPAAVEDKTTTARPTGSSIPSMNLTMKNIPAGTFAMGCPDKQDCDGWDRPVHLVTLSAFEMGETEVTQAQWIAIIGSNPSVYSGHSQRPVDNVSWYDAVVFCNRLSELQGLMPCYYSDADYMQVYGKTGSNWSLPNSGDVHWNRSAKGYRLPTEAEWEYAARGGNATHIYAGGNEVDSVAWYYGVSTQPVKGKAANGFGLYDMSGNAWEWCWDWVDNYPASNQINPTGAASGQYRIVRSGGSRASPRVCRISRRGYASPYARDETMKGFRLARTP